MGADKRFQIALSFPGERRDYVAQVAEHLADALGREHVLYDQWHEAEFARPDLDTYLQTLYHDQSELIAVFLCADRDPAEVAGLILQRWRLNGGAALAPTRAAIAADDDHDYQARLESALAKLLDHQPQLVGVETLLAGAALRVLYAHVDVKLHSRNLAALIDGAAADLRALGDLGTESRVLLLIGAGRDPQRSPFWWRWRHRHAVRRLDCCHGLTAMAPLTGEDVEDWYQGFLALLHHCLDRDRIKTELLDLFAGHGAVRYKRVRKLLLGDGVADPGALRRARLRPCNRGAR